MNAKLVKKLRKAGRQNREEHINLLQSLPFSNRINFAWNIITRKPLKR